MKSDLKAVYPLVVFLKLLVNVVELLNKVPVLSSQVAGLNWSDTIYPRSVPRQNTRKSTFLHEKWSEYTLNQ